TCRAELCAYARIVSTVQFWKFSAHVPGLIQDSPPFSGDRAEHECDIGRPLAEPAHEIGKPLAAERHVDTNPVPGGDQCGLQIATDAEQHLELELGRRQLELRRQ